jgi:cupin-like protein
MGSPSEARAADASAPALPFAVADLSRVPAPSAEAFRRRHLRPGRPVVLTGLTDEWQPAREWTPVRLAERFGDARVVSARLADGKLADDAAGGELFEHVALRDFVASLASGGLACRYVMAPTWNLPAAFQSAYRVPPYCADAPHMRAKVWLGKAGTVTPFHRDVPHNLHVHLFGRKRWLLVAPGESRGMYPRGVLSGMPNFSHVDPERPDFTRHPRFHETTVFAATLGPGETLFIPHGWWHHTRSLDDTVAMNFWWGGRVVQLAAIASATFKRLRGIRQNEWG